MKNVTEQQWTFIVAIIFGLIYGVLAFVFADRTPPSQVPIDCDACSTYCRTDP